MDFGIFFQLRTKKFWWMDVIFYFVASLLVATVLCYVIFLLKNSIQKKEIEEKVLALQSVGTERQKEHEKFVIDYQKKINDFAGLLKNHGFASQVFYFMQQETGPNVWFKNFSLSQKEAVVSLSGESYDSDAFSRQVAAFEKSEYVKNINGLNSALGESTKLGFNLSLTLDPKIFTYIADFNPAPPAEEPLAEPGSENNQAENNSLPEGNENIPAQGNTTAETLPETTAESKQSGFGIIIAVILLTAAAIGAAVAAFFMYKKRFKKPI